MSEQAYIEQSLLPGIAPDRTLGEGLVLGPTDRSLDLVKSLASLGIYPKEEGQSYNVYFGKVTVDGEGVISQARDRVDLTTPSNFGYKDMDESWQFQRSQDQVVEIYGYIESLHLYDIEGRPEPVLRTTPNITDMGCGEDKLIRVNHVKQIASLALWVTEAMDIVDNILAGRPDSKYHPDLSYDMAVDWSEAFFDYLNNDPELRIIWTPKDGALNPW